METCANASAQSVDEPTRARSFKAIDLISPDFGEPYREFFGFHRQVHTWTVNVRITADT
jgi:hypothetical protein